MGELSSSFEYGLNAAAKEYDGENKYIRITDIDDDSREFKQEDITSPDTDLSSAENYRLSEGDILFARTGASVGKSYIYKASDGLVYYAGFLIRARIRPEYNSEFVFQNTLTGDYEKFIRVTSMRSGQPGVNVQEYSQYRIMVPSKPEQDKISDCLRNLDNLITLHQRKCDETKKLKKYMLQKMFPQKNEKKPEIRFAGFTDDWEQRKLGDVFKEYSEKNHTELSALTIIQGGGTVKREDSDRNLMYDESNLSNYKMVRKDDFIVHLRSFEGGLEKSSLDGIISPAYHTFHSDIADSRFYYPYFRSYEFIKHKLVPHVYGIRDGRSIDIDGMKTIEIPYTSMEEQRKIGDYLDSLDHLITLHQRKSFSKNRKKIVWEQRKLGELAEIVGGGTPSTSVESYWNGDIDWYAPAEIGEQIYLKSSQRKITEEGLNKSSAKILPVGTVLFTSRAGIGKTAILLKEGCTNQGYQSIVPNKNKLDSYFIFTRSEELKRYGETVGAGSTFVEVSGKQMANMELMMPTTMDEQQKIGEYFSSLDHLITLHRRAYHHKKRRTYK